MPLSGKILTMFTWLKQKILLFVVFITGAAVLMVEVLAVRILSPYFGATIFTVSSVLSTILLALSLGYYYGGRLADKFPDKKYFYSIILLSGVSIFILLIMMVYLVPTIGYQLSIISGPLILSLLLFLIPSLLLGTLSPYAIRLLSADREVGVGQISGLVFFASTLGSIFGSLSSGFLFIPLFSQKTIIAVIGLVLFMLGTVGTILSVDKKIRAKLWWVFVVAVTLLLLFSYQVVKADGRQYLVNDDGWYSQIKVFDSTLEGRPARYLQLDHNSSSALFLDDQSLVFDYTKYYELHQNLVPDMTTALVLGGGAYTVPKKLLEESPDIIVDVVEVEPKLLPISQQFFFVPESDRLINHVTDARRYLLETETRYDFIFSDAYNTLFSTPDHLVTSEFFTLVKDHVSDNGVLMINSIGSLTLSERSLLMSQIKTLKSVFPAVKVFAVQGRGSSALQNFIIVAARDNSILDDDKLPEYYKNHLVNIDRFDFDQYQVLYDENVSTEHLLIPEFKKFVIRDQFNGAEALLLIKKQLSFGPRFVGSSGHQELKAFITRELNDRTDNVITQTFISSEPEKSVELANIIGQIYPDKENRFLLITHFDTKQFADQDRSIPSSPVPGANDGASGVALQLELIAELKETLADKSYGLDVVFFDGEEIQYGQRADWIPLGSKYFIDHLDDYYSDKNIAGVINLDLVCDKHLQIYSEGFSQTQASTLNQHIFSIAEELYPQNFNSERKYDIIDDHYAFIKAGIPAILLIDLDYPQFHTTQDSLSQCSASSLTKVGNVLKQFFITE